MRYRASQVLFEMGGRAKNRFAVVKVYRTVNGHRSLRHGYAAINRAIEAGEVRLHWDGSVELAARAHYQVERRTWRRERKLVMRGDLELRRVLHQLAEQRGE